MEIRDALLDAIGARVDQLAFFTLAPLQSVKTQEETIFGADDMFFSFVAPETAEFDKVSGVTNGIGYSCQS